MRKENLGSILKSFLYWITTLISLISSIFGLIKLIQGDVDLFATIALIIGTFLFIIICVYFYFGKIESPLDEVGLRYRSKRTRRVALSGLFLIPVLLVASFWSWHLYQVRLPDKLVVLVADFYSLQPKQLMVTERILENLRDSTTKYQDVEIQSLGDKITVQQGNQFARKKGKERKAIIIMWGWYQSSDNQVEVTTHFEVLKKPEPLDLKRSFQVLQAEATSEKSFEVQTYLSKQMSYLTLLTLGLIRYQEQDYNGAIARFSDAVNQTPSKELIFPGDVFFYRGNSFLFIGDKDKAFKDYKQAISLNPKTSAEAFNNLGTIYKDSKKYQEAIQNFNKANELKPSYEAPYFNKGITYYSLKDYSKSIQEFDEAIQLNSKEMKLRYYRGRAYADLGNTTKATIDFTDTIENDPEFAEAYADLGIIKFKQGHKAQAKENFEIAAKLFKKQEKEKEYNAAIKVLKEL